MKIINLFLLAILTTSNVFTTVYSNSKELFFCPIKGSNFGLSEEFLVQIKNVFNPAIFIETGTYLGNTTTLAASIFDKVYSVELGENLYQNAVARFKEENKTNIDLFNSDSPDFLKCVIPQINQTMAIFLDAHWSEGNTVKGENNTPIITELDVIKNSRKSDCIILVDDIRCFRESTDNMEPSHSGYPTIDLLISKGKEIFDNLGFTIFGDIAIMYDANLHNIKISSVLNALTQYKLSGLYNTISKQDILCLYNDIGSAKGIELNGISWLMNLTKSKSTYLYEDFLIWHAFTLMHSNNTKSLAPILNALNKDQLSSFNKMMIDFLKTKAIR